MANEGYVYTQAGVSAIGSIMADSAKTKMFKAQLESETNNIIANMDNQLNTYELNAYKLQEDYNTLDSMFADKISERTLQGMKDFSTMKVAAAETGTSGGSTSEAVNEAFVTEMFDVAIINANRTTELGGILRQKEISDQNVLNAFDSLASGGYSPQASSMTAALGAGTAALGNMISTMPDSMKADLYGYESTIPEPAVSYDGSIGRL
jgi:hypothetical protein